MVRFLAVIRMEDVVQANQDSAQWDDDSTTHFYAPLNGDGLLTTTPSHYWASRDVSEVSYRILQSLMATYPGSSLTLWDLDADPGLPDRVLTQLGLQRIRGPEGP